MRLLAIPPDDPTRNIKLVTYSPDTIAEARLSPVRAIEPKDDNPRLMPDLFGLSLREAALIAARRGLSVEIHGSGSVVNQSPLPGTPLESGMVCTLQLRPSAAGSLPTRPRPVS